MNSIKIFFHIFALSSFLLACSSLPKPGRSPSTEESSFSEAQRYNFYIQLIPSSERIEISLKMAEFKSMQSSCLQTDYGIFIRPMANAAETNQRDNFLLSRLNRPFFFVPILGNSLDLRAVGRINDLKELTCIKLVLDEGKTISDVPNNISSEFLKKILLLPNINSLVLDLILDYWADGFQDVDTGQAIINHPLFNQFHAKTIILKIYKNQMLPIARMRLLKSLMKSKIFTLYASELGTLILKSAQRVSVEEKYSISELAMSEKIKLDQEIWVAFTITEPNPAKDYTFLFMHFAENQSIERKFELLSLFLSSGARIESAESILMNLWKQDSNSALKEKMVIFALSDITSSKWFQRETVFALMEEGLSRPFSAKGIERVISLVRTNQAMSPIRQLSTLKHISKQKNLDDSNAKGFIDCLIELGFQNSQDGAELLQASEYLGMSMRGNSEVFASYLQLIKSLNNQQAKMELLQRLLPDERISENFLLAAMRGVNTLKNESSFQFFKSLLAQPHVTDNFLLGLVNLIEKPFHLMSAEDKRFLTLVSNDPRATLEIKNKIEKALNPINIPFVEEQNGH